MLANIIGYDNESAIFSDGLALDYNRIPKELLVVNYIQYADEVFLSEHCILVEPQMIIINNEICIRIATYNDFIICLLKSSKYSNNKLIMVNNKMCYDIISGFDELQNEIKKSDQVMVTFFYSSSINSKFNKR